MRRGDREVQVDRDLVERAHRGDPRGIRRPGAPGQRQLSTPLPIGSCATLASPRTRCPERPRARLAPHSEAPRSGDGFEAWIHRILVHACYDESQRARHRTANIRVLPIGGLSTPDDSAAIADRDELERAFRPADRTASGIRPAPLSPASLVEIAELLEIPAGTARSRLHYAIAGLRVALTAAREPIVNGGRLA